MSFKRSKVEPRLYYFKRSKDFIILCVVVDNIAFASKNSTMMNQFKESFRTSFDVKFDGELKYFIQWTIKRTPDEIFVIQNSYCKRLLSRFNMENCNPVRTPLSTKVDLGSRQFNETTLNRNAQHTFRAIIGKISYLAHCTRRDIAF